MSVGAGSRYGPRGGGFEGARVPSAPSLGRISLVEPGPVTTEFEEKVYEEAERADYSRTDPETANIFTNLYLRNSRDVFASLGQTPEDIAEVTGGLVPCRAGGCPLLLPSSPGLGGAGLGCLEKPQLALTRSSDPQLAAGQGSRPDCSFPPSSILRG